MQKNHRFEFLDGLRGIAAFAVVIYHFTMHGGRWGTIFASANLAVDFFFCLSGFVIALAYERKLADGSDKLIYVKKRLIRLYPMFLIGLIMGLVALLFKFKFQQTEYSLAEITEATILNFFYIPYVNSGSYQVFNDAINGTAFPANNAAWSLFFELVANLLFIFTVKLSKPIIIVLTAVLGFWLIFYSIDTNGTAGWGEGHILGGFPRVGYSFMMGVLLFRFFSPTTKLRVSPIVVATVLIAIMLVPRGDNWIYFYLVSTLVSLPIIVWLGSKVRITGVLSKKLLEYLGRISYPLYCIHTPILTLLSCFFPNPSHFYPFTIISVIGITVLTHCIMVYIDEPLRDRLNNRIKNS